MTAHVDNKDVWTWSAADLLPADKVVVVCLRGITIGGFLQVQSCLDQSWKIPARLNYYCQITAEYRECGFL